MRVVLHIDRLVLNGYPAEQQRAFVDGLRDELARHYADPQAARLLQGRPNVERVRAGRVPGANTMAPRAVGRQAARGILKGLAR
jgi:hypothetical protein